MFLVMLQPARPLTWPGERARRRNVDCKCRHSAVLRGYCSRVIFPFHPFSSRQPQLLTISFHRGVRRNGKNQKAGASRTGPSSPLRRGSETNMFQPEWSSECVEAAERINEAHRAAGAVRQDRDAMLTGGCVRGCGNDPFLTFTGTKASGKKGSFPWW
jgi:hypothetical protein